MEASPPPFFKRGPSPLFRLVVFALAAIVLMALDARHRYLEPVRAAVSVALHPLQMIAAAPIAVAARIGEFFVTSEALRERNERLARAQVEAAGSVQRLAALEAENAELRGLLDARSRHGHGSVLAEVIYGARDPFAQQVVVDRGSTDKVEGGLAVVDETGVLGQVTRVYPFVAEVTLVTDKNQAVPVKVLRTGLRAIVFGNGRDATLELRFMPVNADIQTGDMLVTSGIDGTYPPGLPVATVTHIERSASLAFARIVCTPLAGVNRRGHVLILTDRRAVPERPQETEPERKQRKGRKGAR